MDTQALIEAVRQRQIDEGWNDAETARQLGVSAVTWHLILHGKRGAGLVFVQRAIARFPEYRDLLFAVA